MLTLLVMLISILILAISTVYGINLYQALNKNTIGFIKKHPNAGIARGTRWSAGRDIYLPTTIVLPPKTITKVPLGFSLDCSLTNRYFIAMLIRSSVASKGITLVNSLGVIDVDYKDELCALLYNVTDGEVVLQERDRIVQLLFISLTGVELTHTNQSPECLFGSRLGGFGSTGE